LTAYFISGLGADQRAFQRIHLDGSVNIRHIKWIDPIRNESLQQYTSRIAAQIDQKQEFILIGLSFGGMLAIELARILSPKRIILISSITDRKQLPVFFRIVGMLKLNRLVPGRLFKKPNFLIYQLFGAKNEKDRQLLLEIFKDASPRYLYWSINQILNWKNDFIPSGYYHIHGEKDKLLPVKRTHPHKIIKGAGHLMILTHAGEVGRLINEELVKNTPQQLLTTELSTYSRPHD